ncbi:ABC transporter substrate-binding protein [Enterococcus dispar]|uniref:Pheromone-binding protein n=1 Tax=Enterococcus dispar ATCC 51266 TaxID=1139219 RepID=S0KM17_9ENTE|nr:peptide ABC transporter substrate-binding protein [Enterococcus dispar]EOT40241.1 pheromone-binding protein [Enterococcus dispar ATCC 51266]EOW86476.1 pheromone-binding protein [Enterococcus dispar ATCC 51266]MCU7357390.1 peptide ABC transporter substrate-binding protein [Enterococcus dispar]MDT2706026.1 peptide ABC transporter substrate-binding protein [Enterococcus dispar]OJG39561.1 pheromone-binding protein [Enterococcus dispar]
MKRKKSILVATGILAALTLAGCTSGGATSKSASSATKQAAKQEISVSFPAPLSTLDTTQTTDKVTFTVVQHLFEGLYRFDDKSQPVPALAQKVAISKDGKTYTFTLRDDAKWSNGEKVTANDFLFAWKRLVNPQTMGPNAYLLDNVINSQDIREGKKAIDEIGLKAPDEKTFEVQLKQAQPSFLSVVSIGWLAPQNEKFVTEKKDNYARTSEDLLYTGPFELKDWKQTGDEWTLVKNDAYYDKKDVKLAEVHGSTIKEENTGIQLVDSGELDLQRISGQYVEQFKNDPRLTTEKDVANQFLDFNKKANKALENVHVRKAIALAINKEQLAKNVLNDGATPLNGLIPTGLYKNPETNEDFRKYSGDYNTYDTKAAKSEWDKAKAVIGDELKLKLLVTDDDNGEKIGEYLQSQLQETLPGLKITINKQPKVNLNQSRTDGNYELSVSGWIAGSSELDSYFNLYKTGSSYNYGGYDSKSYTDLVEKARTVDANDPTAFFKDYKEAEKILLDQDAAQVPLYQSASNYLINQKVKGIVFHAYGDYFNLRTASVK